MTTGELPNDISQAANERSERPQDTGVVDPQIDRTDGFDDLSGEGVDRSPITNIHGSAVGAVEIGGL